MVKICLKSALFSLLLLSGLKANDTLVAAKNLISNEAFNHKLELLLEGKSLENERGYIDYSALSSLLKSNSLLDSSSADSRDLSLSFKSDAGAVLFIKAVNEALNATGFVHFTPQRLDLTKEEKIYTIDVQSRYNLDIGSFYNILKRNSIFIKNIQKTGANSYEYELDFGDALLKSNVNVPLNQNVDLKRPLRDYFFTTKNASSVKILANAADSWFAKILFLDKDLKLIQAITSKEKNNSFSSEIPSNAEYMVVGDSFNLDNIRRGLSVFLARWFVINSHLIGFFDLNLDLNLFDFNLLFINLNFILYK